MQGHDPPAKRRKLDASLQEGPANVSDLHSLQGIDRPISPPLPRRRSPVAPIIIQQPTWSFDDVPRNTTAAASSSASAQLLAPEGDGLDKQNTKYEPSPVQLTRIKDLAPYQNVDTVELRDILSDPLIKECWNFNFLFDIDFVMKQFDDDVRDLVQVKIIHGFWQNDDENRISLLEAAERYPNIELLSAYMPDPFGTHHSKVLVLFRHDDCAQIIVHTANMISRDWGNMTQAVWKSPPLPLLSSPTLSNPSDHQEVTTHPIGSGERFKVDFLRYLKAYGSRLKTLSGQLDEYDFSTVKAAFIGSAPSRQQPAAADPSKQTSFGWLGVQEILSTIPTREMPASRPHIIVQVSSIATLGALPTWLTHFESVLARSLGLVGASDGEGCALKKSSNFFEKREAPKLPQNKTPRPDFNVIFPTPNEIRTSLNGYASGGSIHMKLQSLQQQKQLEYMHPIFCHWKSSTAPLAQDSQEQRRGEAFRGPAAPHIKTYIRFSDEEHKIIEWAMVTSANLSKQAWGDVVNKKEQIWIQSWEAGVVVWPALFADPDQARQTVMVPVFGRDVPEAADYDGTESKVVGFRMPYDLPLTPYGVDDSPWCATMEYLELDWKGRAWAGYER